MEMKFAVDEVFLKAFDIAHFDLPAFDSASERVCQNVLGKGRPGCHNREKNS